MRKLSLNEARTINGGRTYSCPFCHGYSGSYWKVYAHAMKCSYFNSTVFRIGWTAAIKLLTRGLTAGLAG